MTESPTSPTSYGVTVHQLQPDGTTGPALAHGFLVGPSGVMVPGPPRDVTDPWQSYIVRVIPDPDSGKGGPEELRVGGISLAALTVDGVRAAAALLMLARASRHSDAFVAPTLAALTASLQQNRGDLWATYAALGFPIRPPVHVESVEAWWLDHAVSEYSAFAEALGCRLVCRTGCTHCG